MLEPARDAVQQLVADLAAEAVVDLGEALKIERDNRNSLARRSRRRDDLPEPVEEQFAVGESGQWIVIGQIIETFFFVDVLQAERDIAGQLAQQMQFLLIEECGFGRT